VTTIDRERQLRAGVGLLEVRTRQQWGARFKLLVNGFWVDGYTTPRSVTEPAVAGFNHISVTNPGAYSSNDVHMRAIESIGISRFPNTGGSYNGAVMPGGKLYELQPWGRRGAHTTNTRHWTLCMMTGCPSRGNSLAAPSWNNNVNGRALVFARNVDDAVTDADVLAAGRYWAGYKLCGLMRLDAKLHGHRCCASKDCPGNRVWVRMADIRDATADYVRKGLRAEEGDDVPNTREELVAASRIAVHGLLREAAAATTESTADDQFNTATGRQVRTFLQQIIDPATVDEDELRAALAEDPGDLTPNP
jgi:hypothetical protein